MEEVESGQSIIENIKTSGLSGNDLRIGECLQVSDNLVRLKHSASLVIDQATYPVDFVAENLVTFLKGLHRKCGADLAGCMLKDWDNIDISMVSDLDVVQLQRTGVAELFEHSPQDPGMVQQWQRQQVFEKYKNLKAGLLANGAADYVKSIENNNDIAQVIKQMQTV